MQGNNITMLVSACFVFLLGFCVHLNKGRKILIILKRTISFELNYREVVVIFWYFAANSFIFRTWLNLLIFNPIEMGKHEKNLNLIHRSFSFVFFCLCSLSNNVFIFSGYESIALLTNIFNSSTDVQKVYSSLQQQSSVTNVDFLLLQPGYLSSFNTLSRGENWVSNT